MDRGERVQQLMQEAENVGLRLEFDCGLLVVEQAQSANPDRQEAIIAQLAKYAADVHRLLERRAAGARAAAFVGGRIWGEMGPGILIRGLENGELTVRVSAEMRRSDQFETRQSQVSIGAEAQNLLIIIAAAPASPGEPTPEPRGGFFDRLRSSSRRA